MGPLNFQDKILNAQTLATWRDSHRNNGKKLAATNGCFDLLHAGHVSYLQAARNEADALIVGINSDRSISELKGPNRPINTETDRASVIAALASVDGVFIFDELRATEFLKQVQPDVYIKGGDYALEELPEEERQVVAQIGGVIKLLELIPGKSSSDIAQKILNI